MEGLAEVRARQQEIEREWQWLHDALNTVALAHADKATQQRSGSCSSRMAVGQRRGRDSDQDGALEGCC